MPVVFRKESAAVTIQADISLLEQTSFKKSICVISSKLIIAPNFFARINSSAGVSLDENIMELPSANPQRSLIINSVKEEQSVPHPSSFKILRIAGVGVAFTAKYSLNPSFHENAFINHELSV